MATNSVTALLVSLLMAESTVYLLFICLAIKFSLRVPALDSGKGMLRTDVTTQSEEAWKFAYQAGASLSIKYGIGLILLSSVKTALFEPSVLLTVIYVLIALGLFISIKPVVNSKTVAKFGWPDKGDVNDPTLY